MRASKSIKETLYQRQKGCCAICGQQGTHLEVTQIFAGSEEDKFEISNLMLLCPSCNHQIDFRDFREIDLVNYLALLASQHPDFKTIRQEVSYGRDFPHRVDIELKTTTNETLLIDVRNMPAYAPSRTDGLLMTLLEFKKFWPDARVVLAFPGMFSSTLLEVFNSHGIEVWDQKIISTKFHDQILANPHPLFSHIFGAPVSTKEEEQLAYQLDKIIPGKKDWHKYESLIASILDFLFSKTLSPPITNRPTSSKINRRDIILPNYCETGFWLYLRHRYRADYIVVDAKNYKELVEKNDVLQIANYLKQHGTGLFGLIITRNGENEGSLETRKEQWTNYNKLIIVLNDDDIKAMLASNHSEEIIKQKIEDFRLDL